MILDIAMPFYGDTKLFKESALSVLSQSSPSWRLLILNDAHPDFSIDEWVHTLSDTRITYIRNESNLGPSLNYSRCLELLKGTHCVILGADDLLTTSFVERAVSVIADFPGHALYHPYVDVIDEFGNPYLPLVDRVKQMLTPKVLIPSSVGYQEIMKSILLGNWMYFPSIVWRLKDLKEFGFRKDLNVCQDLWLISEILMAGKRIVVFPERIFKYRRFQ
jgi:glycosyltransferase involved in cell wall biosynthesis